MSVFRNIPRGLVAVTGVANSGKTTIINALARRGEVTLPEVAAQLIKEGIKPENDWERFDSTRWLRQRHNEESLPPYPQERGTAKLDRSLLEMVVYNRAMRRPIPDYFHELVWYIGRPRYPLFFQMPAYPWIEDGLRYEAKGDPVKAREFQEYMAPFHWNVYTEFGGKGYHVPKDMTTDQQVDFILDVCRYEEERGLFAA